jgi:hypothetical protein
MARTSNRAVRPRLPLLTARASGPPQGLPAGGRTSASEHHREIRASASIGRTALRQHPRRLNPSEEVRGRRRTQRACIDSTISEGLSTRNAIR